MPSSPLKRTVDWLADALHYRAQAGNLLLLILRGCFLIILIGVATWITTFLKPYDTPSYPILLFSGVLCAGALIVGTDILVRKKQITSLSAIYFGLFLGLLLGWLFSLALEPFKGEKGLTEGQIQAI